MYQVIAQKEKKKRTKQAQKNQKKTFQLRIRKSYKLEVCNQTFYSVFFLKIIVDLFVTEIANWSFKCSYSKLSSKLRMLDSLISYIYRLHLIFVCDI